MNLINGAKPSKVTLVRDLELPRQINVKVCKDFVVPTFDEFECLEDPDVYDKFLQQQLVENTAVAEKRGKTADKKIARENWLKTKIDKAEKEMKESVALVEKLRSARIIQKQRCKETINEANKENEPDEESNEYDSNEYHNFQKQPAPRRVTFDSKKPAPRRIIKPLQPPETKRKSTILKPRQKTVEEKVNEELSERLQRVMLSRIDEESSSCTDYTSVDPGSDYGGLPTPYDDSGRCPTDDEVDHVPVRGPSRQEDAQNSQTSTCLRIGSTNNKKPGAASSKRRSQQPGSERSQQPGRDRSQRTGQSQFSGCESLAGIGNIPLNTSPSKSCNSSKSSSCSDSGILSASTDLQSIAIIIDRIKQHRKFLEKEASRRSESSVSDTVDHADPSVIGSLATQLSNLGTSLKTSKTKEFKLNKLFLKKLLEFESLSPFSTSSSSATSLQKDTKSYRDVKKQGGRTKNTNSTSSTDYSTRDTMDSRILSGNLDSTTTNSTDSTSASSQQTTYKNARVVPKKDPKADDVLRYYIEKLLSMKHEEIRDLSISSSDSRTRSEIEPSRSDLELTRSRSELTRCRSELTGSVSNSTKAETDSTLTSTNGLDIEAGRSKMLSPFQGSLHSSLKSPGSSSLRSSSSSGKHVTFEGKESVYEKMEASLDRTLYKSLHSFRLDKEDETRDENEHLSSDEVDKGNRLLDSSASYREIQRLYKQKRRELEEQLRELEQNKDSNEENIYRISEGSLSSSSTESTQSKNKQQPSVSSTLQNLNLMRREDRDCSKSQEDLEKSDINHPAQVTRKLMYAEETSFQDQGTSSNSGPSKQIRHQKNLWFQEKILFDSLLSEAGTDSESGSMLSRIDLSSDVSASFNNS